LVDFAKDNQEKVTLRGGLVEGQLLDRNGLTGLAMLPSRPELLAQVVWALEAPMADLAMAVEGALGELAWVLEEAGKAATPAEPIAEPQAGGQET
ncbi:MAG: 50S ribosomal protein L10, partial [Candidatus Omnitrophica bacterium]|nr:50S ribosomal protein L10 [Candidatus Omnitrophota bacterium]